MKKLIFYIVAPLSAERKHNYKNKVFFTKPTAPIKKQSRSSAFLIFIFYGDKKSD